MNPTGKTNEEVLAESTKVAQEAAKMIGGTYTQGSFDASGNLTGGFKADPKATIEQNFGTFQPIAPQDSPYDTLAKDLYAQSQGLETDQATIRQNYINQFQDRINALNQVYDQQLAKAQQEGVGRVGQGTAILARRGLAGSPRGGAIQEGILEHNRSIESSIQAERNAKIQEIYGLATTLAAQEAKERREAKQAGATSYLEYLKGAEERKQGYVSQNIAAILAGGYNINEIDVDSLAKILGVSRQTILSGYQQAKLARDKELEAAQYERAGEDQKRALAVAEFNLKEQIAEIDRQYKQGRLSLDARNIALQEAKFEFEQQGGNNEYAKALQFVADNPDADPKELEQGIRANTKGLSEASIKSLISGTQLTRENVAALYGIADDDGKSWHGFGKTNKEKLDEIMDAIKKYQDVGYSDSEILKMIQE